MTLILIGMASMFAAIFYIGTKEPSDEVVSSTLSNAVVDILRKCSFISANDPLKSIIYTEYEKSLEDVQKREWLCDRFINSLDTKEKLNESKEESRSPSRKGTGFLTRFIDALLSVDKDHGDETNEDSPNACKTTGEPVTMFSGIEMSMPHGAGEHDDEETFKAVERLPQARKRSLIMSIFGRLMGLDDCDVVNDKVVNTTEKVGIVYTCTKVLQDICYSYLPLFLTDRLKFEKEAIANLPLVVLISATISSGLTKKIVEKIGSKWTFILADLLVIGASLWCYFLTQSTRVLIYPAAVFLGFGLSAMFVNALSFAAELVGENKCT